MKRTEDNDNATIKLLTKYKSELLNHSLEYEDLIQELEPNAPAIVDFKVDGLICAIQAEGEKSIIYFSDGTSLEDLPVLNEVNKILKNADVEKGTFFGELYIVDDKGEVIQSKNILGDIRRFKSKQEEKKVNLVIFDVYEAEGKKVEDMSSNKYWKRYLFVEDLFKEGTLVKSMAAKKEGIEDIEKFWEKISSGTIEGIAIQEKKDNIKVNPLSVQHLAIIGIEKKENTISSILVAYMPEENVFYYAGKVKEGIDQDKEGLLEWVDRVKISEQNNIIFVDPQKEPKIAEVFSSELLLSPRPVYKFKDGKYEKIDQRMSAVGKNARLIKLILDLKQTPFNLGLDQIPNYPETEKHEEDFKIAASYLPPIVTDAYIQKFGPMLQRDEVYDLYNGLEQRQNAHSLAILSWLEQDGWKIAIGSDRLFVTNGKTAYSWYPKLTKFAVQDGNTAPYWISDMDATETVDPEGFYQMHQYPFMSPSSCGNEIYFDQESPKERLEQVKWISTSKVLNLVKDAESLKEIQEIVKDPTWQKLREDLSWKKENINSSLRRLKEYLGDNPVRSKRVRVLNLLNAVARGGIMTSEIKAMQESLKKHLEKSAEPSDASTNFDFRTNREVGEDTFFNDEVSGGSLEKDSPWFIYMKGGSIPTIIMQALRQVKEGSVKSIIAASMDLSITPSKSITPSVTPRTTYNVAPKLTTDPGGRPGIYPLHPYFYGIFPSTSKVLNLVKEANEVK